MNCKPGDLAVCIRHASSVPASPLGRLCTILYASPLHDSVLPDGYRQVGRSERGHEEVAEWVVEWQHEIAYPMKTGDVRWTRFGVCVDSALRPIRDPGEDARDQTLDWLPSPTKELA